MRLWVDFNDIEDEDLITADWDNFEGFSPKNGPRQGDTIEMTDGGGHFCIGRVVAFDPESRLVDLRMDWSTWQSERHPRLHVVVNRSEGRSPTAFRVRAQEEAAL